jgi:hypothetical protein
VSSSNDPASATVTSATTAASPRESAGPVPDYRKGGNGRGSRDKNRRTAGQVGTLVVLVAALLLSGVTRWFAMRFQDTHSPRGGRATASRASLAGMDSYALALLLGGLRGPLVMVLWAQSEAQKADRDLEGINTQIEWIRRLQPEFDTVHVFQMWNKAYNLSVQMVGLSNKYTTILDAADYGWSIDAERPDNINILKEMARIYGDKLGGSNPEKHYFRERLRRETKWREPTGVAGSGQRGDPGFQRLAHDPLLDPAGNILPKYLQPRVAIGVYDGSALQFIKQYEPFPYGVSPMALGYNFHKRAQLLMDLTGQKPTQVSESVIDAQPALALKIWAEEEWERARRMEVKAFGERLAYERLDLELPTAAKPVDGGFKDASVLPEMIYCYDMMVRLVDDSTKEYERHLAKPEYKAKRSLYASHMDQLLGMRGMAVGDRDYLKAMLAPAGSPERAALLASSARGYHDSIRDFGLTSLRYFTSDQLAGAVMRPGVTRANVGTGAIGSTTSVTDEDVLRMMAGIRQLLDAPGSKWIDENSEDRKEYEAYISRATQRLQQIQQASKSSSSSS